MSHQILAETTASISELKKNPMGTVAAGEGFPVAILNRKAPEHTLAFLYSYSRLAIDSAF